MKRGTCKCGCGRVLKEIGQCSYCRRSLDCCGNEDAVGSCANKFRAMTPASQARSLRAQEAYWTPKYKMEGSA